MDDSPCEWLVRMLSYINSESWNDRNVFLPSSFMSLFL
uniref:Aldehyde dehydrogenase family 2 member B7-like n=1 Tax=Rhizophora mucronata TaxID=61149 RepID=A0A2P2K5Y2_RHIMU